jgi:hypothetical protein
MSAVIGAQHIYSIKLFQGHSIYTVLNYFRGMVNWINELLELQYLPHFAQHFHKKIMPIYISTVWLDGKPHGWMQGSK